MIFLTVGTTRFPFDRLLKVVDKNLIRMNSREKLIVQSGISHYQFKYPGAKVFKEIPFDRMLSYFRRARVTITHGGPATIFLALKNSKNKPLVIPRLSEFKEHINNHQEIFVKSLSQKRIIRAVLSPENLKEEISGYLKKPVALGEIMKIEADKKLIKNLINYTKSL
jgi:UDP-N-acetylglucosamine transferase subunit ALG13